MWKLQGTQVQGSGAQITDRMAAGRDDKSTTFGSPTIGFFMQMSFPWLRAGRSHVWASGQVFIEACSCVVPRRAVGFMCGRVVWWCCYFYIMLLLVYPQPVVSM